VREDVPLQGFRPTADVDVQTLGAEYKDADIRRALALGAERRIV
jgi:hypothetical protein